MKKILASAVIGVCLTSGAAYAQYDDDDKKVRPTYTFAGVKYITQDLDDVNGGECTQDGIIVDGSFDIDGAFFARAAMTDVTGDFCGSTSLRIGGGYRAAWGESSHVYGTVNFNDVSPDGGGGDSGLIIGGGIRGYVSPGIEGYAEVEYSTLFDGDLNFNAGGAYWFTGQFSATLDLGFGGDQRSFAIGGRFAF